MWRRSFKSSRPVQRVFYYLLFFLCSTYQAVYVSFLGRGSVFQFLEPGVAALDNLGVRACAPKGGYGCLQKGPFAERV